MLFRVKFGRSLAFLPEITPLKSIILRCLKKFVVYYYQQIVFYNGAVEKVQSARLPTPNPQPHPYYIRFNTRSSNLISETDILV